VFYLKGSKSVQVFYCFFYIFVVIGDPIIRGGEGIPLTDLTLSHFNACPWTWTFNAICRSLYGVKLFEKTGCLFVCFVDISGIVDHHCLNCIFIIGSGYSDFLHQ
jgi:hypothetical protein